MKESNPHFQDIFIELLLMANTGHRMANNTARFNLCSQSACRLIREDKIEQLNR